MRQRRLIKQQILSAWHDTIFEDYCAHKINSERSLQASFWGHLWPLLPKNRHLLIEPTVRVYGAAKRTTPDLVVCNTRKVIAVVELKYLPRGRPRYKKDIENLAWLAENRSHAYVTAERFHGPRAMRTEFPVADHVLWVWAGVHRHLRRSKEEAFSDGLERLRGCFLEIHAETHLNAKPDVYYYS